MSCEKILSQSSHSWPSVVDTVAWKWFRKKCGWHLFHKIPNLELPNCSFSFFCMKVLPCCWLHCFEFHATFWSVQFIGKHYMTEWAQTYGSQPVMQWVVYCRSDYNKPSLVHPGSCCFLTLHGLDPGRIASAIWVELSPNPPPPPSSRHKLDTTQSINILPSVSYNTLMMFLKMKAFQCIMYNWV